MSDAYTPAEPTPAGPQRDSEPVRERAVEPELHARPELLALQHEIQVICR